jgi:lipoprotein-anchoring transpeptidase ErfK/SrfK
MRKILKVTSLTAVALAATLSVSSGTMAFQEDDNSPGVYFAKEQRIRLAALADLQRPTSQVRVTTRQLVDDPTGNTAGNITVISQQHVLYLSLGGGKAMRYEVGVGRPGFKWSGQVRVGRKAEWPTWTPPKEMIARQPEAAKYAKGMPGGPNNPLGARAMYLYKGNTDSLYRIHGTTEPETIGQDVSSGCIRMLNADVSDLYSRVSIGTRVTVM